MLKRGFQFAPGYRLQEFLGRGQFGQVWRATAPGGAASAAKFIDLSDGQGQKEYAAIKRVKQIRHANLMPITAIWLLDEQGQVIEEAPDDAIQTIDLTAREPKGNSAVYPPPAVEPSWLVVAMLLGGKSLQQRLRECVEDGLPGIPPKELISYMDEAAKGIDFLNAPQHDLGDGPIAIQHSDIKPANIVLIGSSAVVCDFGLARILTRNQVTATSAAGTPAYMAPEAISGKPSRTSDQYSLAVSYYHLRTGTLPVNDGSLWEVLDAHRQGKLRLGLVPEAEQEVLRKATDLQWQNRFESNVEMVDALREALRLEGHTKPAFVPKSGSAAAAIVPAPAVDSDPTATLDVPVNESEKSTAPLVHADESTREDVADGAKPTLKVGPLERSGAAASQSVTRWIKRKPKVSAGIGTVALVALLLGTMALRPANSTIKQGDQGGRGAETQQDPTALAREAMSLLGKDESAAIDMYTRALRSDPGLGPSMVQWSGHQGSIMRMIESPDGSQLVTMADGPTPLLWKLTSAGENPTPTRLSGHRELVTSMAIRSGGGQLLTGGADFMARVWDLKASDVVSAALELNGHTGIVEAVAWHPTEPIVATVSSDLQMGIWQLGRGEDGNAATAITTDRRIPIQETLTSLASDRGAKWLAARTIGADLVDESVDVIVFPWDELIHGDGSPQPIRLGANTAKRLAIFDGEDEVIVATGDVGGTVSLYSIEQEKLIRRESVATRADADVEAIGVVPLEQGVVIVTGSSDGSVHWWNYGTGSKVLQRNFCPEWGISCVDVSRDGRWIAAGANDGSVWLWDTTQGEASGAARLDSSSSAVDSVLIDVNSNWLIAGCDDGAVRLWDLRHAKLLALTCPTSIKDTIETPRYDQDRTPVAMR